MQHDTVLCDTMILHCFPYEFGRELGFWGKGWILLTKKVNLRTRLEMLDIWIVELLGIFFKRAGSGKPLVKWDEKKCVLLTCKTIVHVFDLNKCLGLSLAEWIVIALVCSLSLCQTLFLKVRRIDLVVWLGVMCRVVIFWVINSTVYPKCCLWKWAGWLAGKYSCCTEDTCIFESCLCTQTWIGTFPLINMFWEWWMLMTT